MATTLKKCPICLHEASMGEIKLHKIEDKSVITSQIGNITRGSLVKKLFEHDGDGKEIK